MGATTGPELRDLIYLDFAKASSLLSQIEGGLSQEMRETSEVTRGRRASGGLNLAAIAKAEIGGDSQEKTSLYESRVLHHGLLTKLEQWLQEQGQVRDLNLFLNESDLSNDGIRKLIGTPSFIVAEGYAEFHDYGKFMRYTGALNALNHFFSQAAESAAKNTPDYQQVLQQVQAMKDQAESEKNPKLRGEKRKQAREFERSLEALVAQQPSMVEEYLVNGLRLLTETMMPHRLNLRIFPYTSNPEFSVIANLKRDCFVDADLENVLYAYGMLPNVLLTVFGLITDMSPKDGRIFNSAEELEGLTSDQRQLEQAFRRTVKSLEEMEVHTRFSVYPNITVYPIAVFQRLDMHDALWNRMQEEQDGGDAE